MIEETTNWAIEIIEDHLDHGNPKLAEIIESLAGIVDLPEDFNERLLDKILNTIRTLNY